MGDAQLAELVRAVRAGDRALRSAAPQPVSAAIDVPGVTTATTLGLLRDAAAANQAVLLGYVNAQGSASQRIVEPASVNGGYLHGYDHQRDEMRTFALHRITAVSVLPDDDPARGIADWTRSSRSLGLGTEETARRWAEGLDHRAAVPQQVALRAGVVAAGGPQCPGDLVRGGRQRDRRAARRGVSPPLVGPGGQVLGVEPQPTLARIAADRLGDRAGGRLGVGDRLPVRSGVAAAVVAQTVLLHVPAADQVPTLAEMVRVARPGGRVLSVDQDMDGWVIDHPDRGTTRRLLHFNADRRYGDGWTGRRLAALFRAAGWSTSRWPR